MTVWPDFRDGRCLAADDLDDEGDAIAERLDEHGQRTAHFDTGGDRQLVAHSAMSAAGHRSIELTALGVTINADPTAMAIMNGAAQLSAGLQTGAVTAHRLELHSVPPETVVRPWTIGLYDVKENEQSRSELLVALPPAAGGSAWGARNVSFGTVNGTVFGAVLTVGADGTMRVDDDLEVAGAVVEGPCPPDVGDPRFARELRRRFVDRLIATGNVGNATLTIDQASATGTDVTVKYTVSPLPALTSWAVLARYTAGTDHDAVLAADAAYAGGAKTDTMTVPIRGSVGATCAIQVCFVGFDQTGATIAASGTNIVTRT